MSIKGRIIPPIGCVDGLCMLGKIVDEVDYSYTYKCSEETSEMAENKIDEYILRRLDNAV